MLNTSFMIWLGGRHKACTSLHHMWVASASNDIVWANVNDFFNSLTLLAPYVIIMGYHYLLSVASLQMSKTSMNKEWFAPSWA